MPKSLAPGMVRPEFSAPGTTVEIDILDKTFNAVVIPDSPFDPKNERLRDVNEANN